MSFFGVQINAQLSRLLFEMRLNFSRNKYTPNIRTLYRSFVEYDHEISGLIASYNFQKALNANGIFLKKYDLQVFEKIYYENGKINWFSFLNHLREPMGPHRRYLVQKIFDHMDEEKSGKISVQNLLKKFNKNLIESIKYGRRTASQIQEELLSMLHVKNGEINREQFIAFYDDLNINFGHNDVFFRFVSEQWFYTLQKQEQVRQDQVRKVVLALHSKLIEKTQGSKDQFIISKLFKEFDTNGNSYLGSYQLDLMLKSFNMKISPWLVEPVLRAIDKNSSGYIQYEEFKKFVYHNIY